MNRVPVSIATLVLIAIAFTTGCTREQQQEGGRDAAAMRDQEQNGGRDAVAVRDQRQNGGRDAVAARTPAVQQSRFETLVIPDGTNIVASLSTPLSTETNHTGDPFGATTTEPIIVGGRTVVPAGAQIHGVLRDVEASGRVQGRARMTLAYQTIVDARGTTHEISAVPLTLQAASSTRSDVGKIAAGGILGAIVGGITGGRKGAAIGAGAGAGAGTILVLATTGHEMELATGQRLNVQLTSATSIQLLAQK